MLCKKWRHSTTSDSVLAHSQAAATLAQKVKEKQTPQ